MIKQLSIFVENKFGRLSAVMQVLKENNVDISALSLADTSEFGILRVVVDKPELAKKALRESGVMVKSTEVIAAAMDDCPGGLAKLLEVLTTAHVSIEYMYAFIGKAQGSAWTALRVDNNEKAIEAFNAAGIRMLDTHEQLG